MRRSVILSRSPGDEPVTPMDTLPSIQAPERTRIQQRVVYETACALAESATLVEAAPRMLEAICEALDWEYGALWDVDRAARVLRCAATWHPPSLQVDEFDAVSQHDAFSLASACRDASGPAASPPGFPTSCTMRTSRARRSPAARTARARSAFRSCAATRSSASWSSSAGRFAQPDEELLGDADDGRQPGRPVRRRQARPGGARPILHAVAGSAVHRELRRVLPASESGVGARAGHPARGAALEAVAGLRSPRRSRGHDRRRVGGAAATRAHRVREPLSMRATGRTSGSNGRPSPTPISG